jgi:hypothetical protein
MSHTSDSNNGLQTGSTATESYRHTSQSTSTGAFLSRVLLTTAASGCLHGAGSTALAELAGLSWQGPRLALAWTPDMDGAQSGCMGKLPALPRANWLEASGLGLAAAPANAP